MRTAGLAAIGVTLTGLLGGAAAAAAEPPPGPAGWLYDPDSVVRVDLGLPPDSVAALEDDPDEYQPGSFALENGAEAYGPLAVGIRLKGSYGSFRPLDGKAAFKVKVDEYVDDQTFFGLEKLTFNNMVQDDSMVHEALAYELFRSLGVPASRTGYAFLSVNGEDYGLYLDIETLDSVALPRWLASTRHLYEGSYLNDVRPGGAADFEVDEGKKGQRDDLEALIAAANDEEGDWSEGMAAVADLDEMTMSWAVERYIGHWDGYAGTLVGTQPNNYFLHSEASGLFRMLPWGADQTWESRLDFGRQAGILLNRCLEDASCTAAYREALRRVRAQVASLGLRERAAELAALLRPWQEIDPRREQTMSEIEAAVGRTRAFVDLRAADLAVWLGETGIALPKTPPRPTPLPPGPQPPGLQPPGPQAPQPGFAVLASRGLPGGGIRVRLRLPGAGEVELRGTARIGGEPRPVCLARAALAGPAEAAVGCRLSRLALLRLRGGPLRVRLRTCFAAATGASTCSLGALVLQART
jgi:hypothetical protein